MLSCFSWSSCLSFPLLPLLWSSLHYRFSWSSCLSFSHVPLLWSSLHYRHVTGLHSTKICLHFYQPFMSPSHLTPFPHLKPLNSFSSTLTSFFLSKPEFQSSPSQTYINSTAQALKKIRKRKQCSLPPRLLYRPWFSVSQIWLLQNTQCLFNPPKKKKRRTQTKHKT